ncbi:hypothetical protein ACT3RL_15790 [Halomonas sp. AOP5-CZ2-32]
MSDEYQKPEGLQQNNPLKKLKGSVRNYEQPFDPVGSDDWETILLDVITPHTAHADELATPTLKELGEAPEGER